jgi:hypothetical protein
LRALLERPRTVRKLGEAEELYEQYVAVAARDQ